MSKKKQVLKRLTPKEREYKRSMEKRNQFKPLSRISGRNKLSTCLICGGSFKRDGIIHMVVKSAKGTRLHICSVCAEKYPNAKPYVIASTHRLPSRV